MLSFNKMIESNCDLGEGLAISNDSVAWVDINQNIIFVYKDNKLNTKTEQTKRLKYFNEKRTTSHWPYKINVNSLQPQTYGDDNKLIDYNNLPKIDLENEPYFDDIKKLL